ncbi:MAG: sel1 repeat family protein [Ruminococcus flavefaciens]|nr:sel1 repeat family protein [Ruminococcus flavefaciens]MCM1230425.1 sel1 repeat family protein [Ruminococcus flavefaciens]
MADNLAIDKKFDNPIDVVKVLVEKHGAGILENPADFSAKFSGIAPNLKKDNGIFTMALSQDIAKYFLHASKRTTHKEQVKAVRKELESLLAFEAIETVIEAICQALGWNDIITTKSSAKKQYKLGENYYYGKNGYKQNYKEAVKWYKLSAEKGNSEAQFSLGWCYHFGDGIVRDYKKAFEWYTKSAEQGDEAGKYGLASIYLLGSGATKNLKKAFDLYKESAENDYLAAEYKLAYMYENGIGTEKNLIEAVRWYLKASDDGYELAEVDLKRLLNIK